MGIGEIVSFLLATYGLPGVVILGLAFMYWRAIRRNRELEDRQVTMEAARHEALVGLVKDYAKQSKDLTAVVGKLSGCLQGIKESLDRAERTRELDDLRDSMSKKPTEPPA